MSEIKPKEIIDAIVEHLKGSVTIAEIADAACGRYCSRCKKKVDDNVITVGMTAGYYDVRNTSWSLFADKGEKFLCDDCMWNDIRYIAVYGK